MVVDINSYCNLCHTCRTSKPNNQRLFRMLHPLPVPNRPWEGIGMDFVGPFLEAKSCLGPFDMICTIICLLTGIVHIIPTRQTYRAREIAEIVFETVYKLYRLPSYIVSNRDLLFTSTF